MKTVSLSAVIALVNDQTGEIENYTVEMRDLYFNPNRKFRIPRIELKISESWVKEGEQE